MLDLFLSHIKDRWRGQWSGPARYYTQALSEYDGTFRYLKWNWAAFLGPLYWLCYRRLYKMALIVLALSILARIVPLFLYPWVILGFHVFLGMYGTTYYLEFVTDRIHTKKPPLGVDVQLPILIFVILEAFLLYVLRSTLST